MQFSLHCHELHDYVAYERINERMARRAIPVDALFSAHCLECRFRIRAAHEPAAGFVNRVLGWARLCKEAGHIGSLRFSCSTDCLTNMLVHYSVLSFEDVCHSSLALATSVSLVRVRDGGSWRCPLNLAPE